MSCSRIEPELVGYHFGVVSTEIRKEVELHLTGCSDCLASFFAIKREVETAPVGERPSKLARARLRQAIAQTLGDQARTRRSWFWWERPLAFGFAAAVVIAAMIGVRQLAQSNGTAPRTLALEAAARPSP